MKKMKDVLEIRIKKNITLKNQETDLLEKAISKLQNKLEEDFIPFLELLPQAKHYVKDSDALRIELKNTDFNIVLLDEDFSSVKKSRSKGRKMIAFYRKGNIDNEMVILPISSLGNFFELEFMLFEEKWIFSIPPTSPQKNFLESPKNKKYTDFYLNFILQYKQILYSTHNFFESLGHSDNVSLAQRIDILKKF